MANVKASGAMDSKENVYEHTMSIQEISVCMAFIARILRLLEMGEWLASKCENALGLGKFEVVQVGHHGSNKASQEMQGDM